jgi:hypothetical protein
MTIPHCAGTNLSDKRVLILMTSTGTFLSGVPQEEATAFQD